MIINIFILKPVGVNTPGVVFKYIYTNNDGEKEVAMGMIIFLKMKIIINKLNELLN